MPESSRPLLSGPADGRREPKLTPEEKQDFLEQVEEFEGPDRREKRGSEEEPKKEPGVERA